MLGLKYKSLMCLIKCLCERIYTNSSIYILLGGAGGAALRLRTPPSIKNRSRMFINFYELSPWKLLNVQEALGVLGVNFVHAAIFKAGDVGGIISSLLDELSRSRIEVAYSCYIT